jgi:N-acetylglucosaminyldiphosphoundecaprenol N-acetyl-beta-D-mannosaminyltransferase
MFTYEINGIRISFPKNINQLIRTIDKVISNAVYPCQIVTLNTLIYLQTKLNYLTYQAVKSSLVIPDSFGISFCTSLFSLRFLKKYPGIELIHYLCLLAKQKNYKLYLLGAKQEVVEKAGDVLKQRYGVNIVGIHHGYFFKPKDLSYEVIEDINKKSPDILLVGLPTEIQEGWIYENLKKLNCKIVIGLGGSFDVISGRISRAPKIFRFLNMEWYYRLLLEPWRIKRIIKLPLAFILLFFDCVKGLLKWKQVR